MLLDLALPAVSGYDVLAACATLPAPRLAFLVMTAVDADFLRNLDAGMVAAVVTKPFDVVVLAAIVREAAEAWPNLPAVPQAHGVIPTAALASCKAEWSY